MSGPSPAGLYTERLEVSFELELLAPLRIATGGTWPQTVGAEEPFEVAEVAAGLARIGNTECQVPIIPGSSLKGALRALYAPDAQEALLLFGEPGRDEKEPGRMGLLLIDTAFGTQPLPRCADRRPRRRSTIDPAKGTAADERLFAQDEVPAGSRFACRLTLLGAARPGARGALEGLLGRLAAAGERGLGAGRADGLGRFRALVPTLKVTRSFLAAKTGTWQSQNSPGWDAKLRATLPASVGIAHSVVLKLAAEGPYLTKDPWADPKDNKILSAKPATPTGVLDEPELAPTGLMGSLRQRAVWLADVEDDRDTDLRRRWLDQGRPGAGPIAAVPLLTPVERLFGIPGFRGLLRVAAIEFVRHDGWITLSSVALDRFSMAPIHGALFTTEASLRPRYTVRLELEQRAGVPLAEDMALLEELLADLAAGGAVLPLGHGAAKGFGWFAVQRG